MTEPRELLSAINQGLPNIATYIRVVLSHENLSEEAESLRRRYDSILTALEQGRQPPRPVSLVGDGDSGYFSVNRSRGVTSGDPSGDPSEHLVGFPSVYHSGILLRRDDKFRWHRCWCKVDSTRMKFFIYEDSSEEALVRSFSLENTNVQFNPTIEDYDKENCFVITGITDVAVEVEASNAPKEEIYFAAYCEGEFDQWKGALQLLVSSRESARISLPSLDGSPWAIQTGQDSASTSSSNFSSNRDSMISTTSSLLTSYRNSSRADSQAPEREQVGAEDIKALSQAKQQQPLPSPPHADAKEVDEDGNASEGTIYESIDNLVLQFDETMKATARAMGQVGQNMKSRRRHKKKERTLTRQHSFFSSKSKSHKAKLVSQKKAELEKGEHYSGYLNKRNSSGSWKKKWCCLKGCIFSYYKTPDQTEGNEYVVLDAAIQVIQESKKQFAFGLQCKGVPEMFFAADDEEQFMEWLSRLDAATKESGDLSGNWEMWLQDEDVQDESVIPQETGDTQMIAEGIYNVPRVSADATMYPARGLPPMPPMHPNIMSAQAAIDSGVYSVPHSVLAAPNPQSYPSGNSYDLYDVPRPMSMSPDDGEAIYDDPFDIIDMEIYDYPPDAIDAYNAEVSGLSIAGSARNSTALSSDFASTDRASSVFSDEIWKTMTLPPLPTSGRPSMALSTVSSEEYDYQQSARSSTASSMDGLYDYPRSIPVDPFLSSIVEKPSENAVDAHIPVSALEYGDCTKRGMLYKRERLKQWSKLSCVIRNSFLQCHKAQDPAHSGTPVLKLFLPGSEISTEVDARRPWAFQVKHPRRGNLVFAAEREPEYYQWVRAFRSATSIEVQPVSTIEEIRLTDTDLQRRWSSMEKGVCPSLDELPGDSSNVDEHKRERAGSCSRRKTFPEGAADDYQSDTLKRKRKFSWVKSNLMRKKGDRKSTVDSTASHRLSNVSFDIQVNPPSILSTDPTRRSVSLEMLPAEDELPTPTPVNAQMFSQSHRSISPVGSESFRGFLRVQRKGADSMWVRYWCVVEDGMVGCYISQQDHTLTLSIQLEGSRIAKASYECRREHTFKVWHVESGQCLYFAADSGNEFEKWFKEITKGAELIMPEGASSHFSAAFYYHHKDTAAGDNPSSSQISSRLSNLSLTPSPEEGDNVSMSSGATGESQDSIYQRGDLKKLSQSGKWKDRYCLIKDCTLYVYHSSSEKTPVMAIALQGCSIELLNASADETHRYAFRIVSASGKVHTLAAASELEMSAWISMLQDCSRSKPTHEDVSSKPSNLLSENGAGGGSHSNSPLLFRHSSHGQYKGESSTKGFTEEKLKVLSQKALSRTAVSKKGPIKGDHTIWTTKDEYGTSSGQKSSHELKLLQDSIVRRYEKRIRKTRKVANLTNQNLKQQQAALVHIKKELSRHVIKLQELADSGDTHAQKRFKDIRIKLQQVDKVLPYLAKYVTVNRQAEMQTVAVLKESCTVECQQLTRSVLDTSLGLDSSKAQFSADQQHRHPGNGSDSACVVTSNRESNKVHPAEVNSSPIMESSGSHPEECVDSSLSTALEKKETDEGIPVDQHTEESPYASLSSVRPQPPTAPSRNYAQLDFSQAGGPSVLRPPSVNYAQVDIDPLKGVVVISSSSKISINTSVESVSSSTTAGSQLHNPPNEQSTFLPSNGSVDTEACNENNTVSSEEAITVKPELPNEESEVCPIENSLNTKLQEILSNDGSTVCYTFHDANSDVQVATSANEVQTPDVVSPRTSSVLAAIKQFESSTKAKSPSAPPPVPKKTSRKSSVAGGEISNDLSRNEKGDIQLEGGLREPPTIRDSPRSESRESTPTMDSNLSKNVQCLTEGTPSVLERIRALQQKKS